MFVTNWHQWLRHRILMATRRQHRPTGATHSCRPRCESLEPRLALSTFTVTTSADNGDNVNPLVGSLRQAILDSNANPGADLIALNVPASDARHFYYHDDGAAGVSLANVAVTSAADDSTIADIDPDYVHSWWSIAPTSALPTITDPVTIDGTTQPGFAGSPIIELNGAGAGSASGLVVTAGNSTVRGLVINRFQVTGGFLTDGKGNGIVLATNGGNVLEGDYIGIDVSGTVGLGNRRMGVLIFAGSSGNRIGTNGDGISDTAERNVISGNGTIGDSATGAGVQISDALTSANVVAGNYIGTDATGTAALGNLVNGVGLGRGAKANRIGTDGSPDLFNVNERNVLSGNGAAGVAIAEVGTNNNTVAGNYIGTDVAGAAALGNVRLGVSIFTGAQGNQVGGATPALSNSIAFNGVGGVLVRDRGSDGTTKNRIEGNSIYSNGGLGIDLAPAPAPGGMGVTPNDPGDADTGPNNLQNFPVINVAHSGPKTFVSGTLNSLVGTAFTLDFYASATSDFGADGIAEARRYLGSWTGATVGNDLSFAVLLDAASTAGEVITATATAEPSGDTSEFSAAAPATDLVVTGTGANDTYLVSGHSTGAVEVFLNSVSQGIAAQVFVSDPDGSDTYTVNFGDWTGNVTLSDTGATGTDAFTANGTAADESFNKQAGFVQWKKSTDAIFQTRVDFAGFEAVTLNAAAGNDTIHDPGTNTTILGGPGDDTIIIDATTGNGIVVDGGDGSDSYVVMFGSLAGPVTVADTGVTGSDSLTVQGTPGPDAFALTGNQMQNGTEAVILANPIASLTVAGGGGVDTTTINNFTAPTTNLAVDGSGGTNAVTIVGSPPPGVTLDLSGAVQTVDLNIRRHAVNLNSKRMIAVVLYTTPTFNAARVDLGSILFAGAHVAKSRLKDVDCDGDLDIVLKFRTRNINLLDVYAGLLADADQTVNGKLDKRVSTRQEATLSLMGKTVDGSFFQGFDTLDLFLEGKELKQLVHDLAATGRI